jgi:hypothetical protein
MYDSYKEKWNSVMSNLPSLPNMDWLKEFFSKENLPKLPELPDISMDKGKIIIVVLNNSNHAYLCVQVFDTSVK